MATPAEAAVPPWRGWVLTGIIDHWEPDVVQDARQLRFHPGIVGTFLCWDSVKVGPTVHWLQWVRDHRAAPMLDLTPAKTVRLRDIIAGQEDTRLTEFASAFAAWGHPMLLRVLPEMNGKWESYSPGTHGQTTTQYRMAFRHIVDVFRAAGATNVKMVWNPDRVFVGSTPLRSLWPGKDYVDWVAVDAYNWQSARRGRFGPYKLLAHSAYVIRHITDKPMMVAELGTAPYRYKALWVRHSVAAARAYGYRAIVWFNEQLGPVNVRLDSSTRALRGARYMLHRERVVWPGRHVGMAKIDRFVTTGHY